MAETIGGGTELRCPDCGKVLRNQRGFNVHRALVHGVMTSRGNAAGRKPGRPRKTAAPADPRPDGPGLVAAFAAAAAEIERAEQLLMDCVKGLTIVTGATLKLRRAYIASREQVRKLQEQAATIDSEA